MLDIAQVAKRTGVPASTLRYYEEKGLIASIGRQGLRRVFDARVLDQLALIALGRAAGFSLDEIAAMFTPDGRPQIDRALLGAKAQQIDALIDTAVQRYRGQTGPGVRRVTIRADLFDLPDGRPEGAAARRATETEEPS